ncbi:MAG TPA: ABC transporter permease [Vicinamibacterales bacterium]|nr:ABC transporter permease [Vicinamibacterales bacterium]
MLDSLLQDLRYAVRSCLRTPALTAVAALALAIGIGANTAIFSVVNAVLLERLPYRDPGRVVVLWETWARRPGRNNVLGPSQFVRWKERATAFERMAGLVDTRANLTGSGDPEEIVVQNVTADFFPILGVRPMLGRTFSDAENNDPQSPAVILSYALWQRRFGGDRDIIGRTIQLNSKPNTVVGVMPQGFDLFIRENSLAGKPSDLWSPFVLGADARDRGGRYMQAIALLKPNQTLAQAQAQLTAIAQQLVIETPVRNTGWGARVVPLRDELSGDYRRALLILAGAVTFVLLIACANVANLLLARGAVREREIAIRAALGAGRGRVVRQLLTESLVLALLGGGAGLLVAYGGVRALAALSPVELSAMAGVSLNNAVLGFTAAVSIATAILCGLAPAFEGAKTNVQDALRDGARQIGAGVRRTRLRQAFVVSELALAVVLLVGAGLLLRSFSAVGRIDPGYATTNVLTMRVQLPAAKYGDAAARTRFFSRAADDVRRLPGVQAAGAISFLPLTGQLGAGTSFTIEGQTPPPPGQQNITNVSVCDNGLFGTLQIPLIAGRLFTEREMTERSNVVVVSESLVRTYFPHENPIGKRLLIDMTDPVIPTEIVGVVGDVHFQDLTAEPRPTSYWPHPQLAYSAMTLTVRSAGDPLALAPSIESAIRAVDPDQPVSDVRTMTQWAAKSVAQARFSSFLLAVFAAVALMLASIGIYGVMSYAVSQRTPEIGVRLALGADAGQVIQMVLLDAGRLALAGLAVGIALSLVLTRSIATLLYGTSTTDPATFAAVALLLSAVAFVASYLPARRAARVAPVEALRVS